MKLLLIAFLFLVNIQIQACYNYYTLYGDYETKEGWGPELSTGFPKLPIAFDQQKLLRELMSLSDSLKQTYNYKIHSDYGVTLLKLGKVDKALNIFKFLIKYHPNDYEIQANLGTSYELAGDLESAYGFLNKALKINENAHRDSEWIHLAIIKAKLGLRESPNWFHTNKLFKSVEKMKLYEKHPPYEELGLIMIKQIHTQLETRLPFCNAPNRIICQMLMELGDIYAINVSIDVAWDVYQTARVYQMNDQKQVLDKKIKATLGHMKYLRPKGKYEILLLKVPKGNELVDLKSINPPNYIDQGREFYEDKRQLKLQREALVQAKIEQYEAKKKLWMYVGIGLLICLSLGVSYKVYQLIKSRS